MRPAIPLTTVVVTFAIGGCGGGGATHTVASHTPTMTASQPSTPAALEQAVRRAVEKEHSMSVEVLWTNRVPANPPAIGGPALAILRRSVAQRRRAGVRVRVLSERFRIVSVQLDPSYAAATAVVLENQRVQPTDPNGRRRGGPSAASERVRLQLRRAGNSERFIVWKVTLLR